MPTSKVFVVATSTTMLLVAIITATALSNETQKVDKKIEDEAKAEISSQPYHKEQPTSMVDNNIDHAVTAPRQTIEPTILIDPLYEVQSTNPTKSLSQALQSGTISYHQRQNRAKVLKPQINKFINKFISPITSSNNDIPDVFSSAFLKNISNEYMSFIFSNKTEDILEGAKSDLPIVNEINLAIKYKSENDLLIMDEKVPEEEKLRLLSESIRGNIKKSYESQSPERQRALINSVCSRVYFSAIRKLLNQEIIRDNEAGEPKLLLKSNEEIRKVFLKEAKESLILNNDKLSAAEIMEKAIKINANISKDTDRSLLIISSWTKNKEDFVNYSFKKINNRGLNFGVEYATNSKETRNILLQSINELLNQED